MTAVEPAERPASSTPKPRPNPAAFAHARLRTHDPGFGALRRAGRAALVMPSLVAICDKAIDNSMLAIFVAFGSFAMLLLVDFAGPIRDRIRAQALLGLACALLVCLGTLASRTTWIGVVGMAVIAFAVLFSAVVSSVLAGSTTALLLAFVLPVTLPGPASQIPDRVAGWGLAAAVSVAAIAVLWPAATRDPLRDKTIASCRAIAQRLRAEVEFVSSGAGGESQSAFRAAIAAADAAIADLYTTFFRTPYLPSGLTTSARAIVRLVDDLRWCNAIVLRAQPPPHRPRPVRSLLAIKRAAADVLDRSADTLGAPGDPPEPLDAAVAALHAALEDVERTAITALPGRGEAPPERVLSAVNPSFRAQELSFVTLQIATNTSFAAAAARRGWVARLLGRRPAGFTGFLTSVSERARAHLNPSSTWLHNSLRGAAALALAVLVADLSNVQHGFWVAFGALSVLRSNALATGENTLRAVLGTTLGFVIGGALVYAIGTDTTVLWILLPFAVLVAGVAPSPTPPPRAAQLWCAGRPACAKTESRRSPTLTATAPSTAGSSIPPPPR